MRNIIKYTLGLPWLITITLLVFLIHLWSEIIGFVTGLDFLRFPWGETKQILEIWKPIKKG